MPGNCLLKSTFFEFFAFCARQLLKRWFLMSKLISSSWNGYLQAMRPGFMNLIWKQRHYSPTDTTSNWEAEIEKTSTVAQGVKTIVEKWRRRGCFLPLPRHCGIWVFSAKSEGQHTILFVCLKALECSLPVVISFPFVCEFETYTRGIANVDQVNYLLKNFKMCVDLLMWWYETHFWNRNLNLI